MIDIEQVKDQIKKLQVAHKKQIEKVSGHTSKSTEYYRDRKNLDTIARQLLLNRRILALYQPNGNGPYAV